MKLSELRKICEARTNGEYFIHGESICVIPENDLVENSLDLELSDIDFIAAMAAHAEALLDLIETAKKYHHVDDGRCVCSICSEFLVKMKKLEEI